jgi:hypothetical protein
MKPKGYDKAHAVRRQGLEVIQFNLRTEPEALQLIYLRISQALSRQPNLKDLLEPAIDEINAVMEMNEQSRTALSELK